MASSLKFLCFFLLTTLSFQIHARDSQFFSKVSRNREPDTTTTTTATTTNTNTNNNNALKETEFVPLSSFKQQDKVEEEENPTFLPETEGSGYGFYGHETGLHPPSTATTTTTNNNNNNIHDHEMNYAKELKGLKEYNNDNNNYYLDNNNKVVDQGKYNPTYEKQGMSDTRFMENGKYSYNGGAGYYGGAEKQEIADFPESTSPKLLGNSKSYSTYGGTGYNGGVQRQGMSDTRFLENGKYFYDVNSEINNNNHNNKYYNPNNYNNNKHYNPDNYNNNNNKYYNPNNYNNEYMVRNNGYYGNYKENNYGEFYNNNNNGYKNQVPEEEEFDFDP